MAAGSRPGRSQIRRIGQFALMHMGTSLTVVPVTSALNRIMIADMQLNSVLVAFLVTLPYWLSPFQVWFGSMMDQHVAQGGRRTFWIALGGVIIAGSSILIPPAVFLIPRHPLWGFGGSALAFLVWGLAINLTSVGYFALLSDQSDAEQRSRTVSIMFTCMILASIGTGLFLSRSLDPYTERMVIVSFILLAAIALAAVVAGAWRMETAAPARGPRITPGRVLAGHGASLRVLMHNRAALRFFLYLLIILIGIHAQDVLLEPYGAEVLGSSVAETSRLVSIWGTGFLLTMLASIPVVRVWGARRVAVMGTWIAAAAFVLIIGAGWHRIASVHLFMGAVFLLGIGGGFMTHSNLVIMLGMTIPQARALYMGAWSVASFLGQALVVLPIILGEQLKAVTGNVWAGYSAVFALEAQALLLALLLLRSVQADEFAARARALLHVYIPGRNLYRTEEDQEHGVLQADHYI